MTYGRTGHTLYFSNTALAAGVPFIDDNDKLRGQTTTSATVSFTVTPSNNKYYGLVWEFPYYNTAWEDGATLTVDLVFDTTSSNISCRCRVVSLNNLNVILQLGSFTAYQTAAASRTFTVTAPTWTHSEATTNRIGLEIEIDNTASHGDNTVGFAVGASGECRITSINIEYANETCVPRFELTKFRFRNDDGSETTATWIAAANTNIHTRIFDQTTRRLRLLVKNIGNTVTTAAAVMGFDLKASENWGSYQHPSLNTGIYPYTTSNYVAGDDTTQQLGSGTFESNNNGLSESSANVSTASITWNQNDEVELEYCLVNSTVKKTITRFSVASSHPSTYTQDTISLSTNMSSPTLTVEPQWSVRRVRVLETG